MTILRRIATWGPIAAVAAFVAKEATHGFHIHAPHTLLLCAVPAAVVCACGWCRRLRRRRQEEEGKHT